MLVTIISSVIVLLTVAGLWRRALRQIADLESVRDRLVAALQGKAEELDGDFVRQLVEDIGNALHQRALTNLTTADRRLALGAHRANADAAMAQVTMNIELMPQVGFLGTVAGLIVSFLLSEDLSLQGMGMALSTTAIGLIGFFFSRILSETKATRVHGTVSYLLTDPRLLG